MAGKGKRSGYICCLLLLVALGCSKKEASQAALPTARQAASVYAVNYPLAYFAERLAPEGIEVVFPAPLNVDPAFWKPTPDAIGQYQSAQLILLNGAGYARWTRYATLPKSRMVVTVEGCREELLQTGEAVAHQHGPGGQHAHQGTAFTTWLDMSLALCQASHVRDALMDLSPANIDAIDAKFDALRADLTQLDTRLRGASEAWGDRPMLASHPVYQYLSDAYGLRIESVHFEPDEALGPKDIEELESLVARHPAKLMLFEADPLPETKRLLRDHGIATVVFNPAAQPPSDGDFLRVMTDNADRLACATGAQTCP